MSFGLDKQRSIQAYAVLAGGGVRGAAIAGGLSAAKEIGFDFLGYGGTSAGSIVAYLAALGCSDTELQQLIVEVPFSHYLSNDGRDLQQIFDAKRVFAPWCTFESWFGVKTLTAAVRSIGPLTRARRNPGLDDGTALRRLLLEQARNKLDLPPECDDLTFSELGRRDIDLRVVATDLTNARPVVWPRDSEQYGDSVVDAVFASCCFPYIFQPHRSGDYVMVDGGLASNLPSFLFHAENQAYRRQTVAIDIGRQVRPKVDTAKDLLLACYGSISSSDDLLRQINPYVLHIPVALRPDIGVFDINLAVDDRRALYDTGRSQASATLHRSWPVAGTDERVGPGGGKREKITSRSSPAVLIKLLLASFAEEVAKLGMTDPRVCIMTPTTRATRIVDKQFGMDEDPDRFLELSLDAGATGEAWKSRQVTFADLEAAASNPSDWGMNDAQQKLVRADRKSMLAAPILGVVRGKVDRLEPIATISADSSASVASIGIFDQADLAEGVESPQLTDTGVKLRNLVVMWAEVFERMLD